MNHRKEDCFEQEKVQNVTSFVVAHHAGVVIQAEETQ